MGPVDETSVDAFRHLRLQSNITAALTSELTIIDFAPVDADIAISSIKGGVICLTLQLIANSPGHFYPGILHGYQEVQEGARQRGTDPAPMQAIGVPSGGRALRLGVPTPIYYLRRPGSSCVASTLRTLLRERRHGVLARPCPLIPTQQSWGRKLGIGKIRRSLRCVRCDLLDGYKRRFTLSRLTPSFGRYVQYCHTLFGEYTPSQPDSCSGRNKLKITDTPD